MSRTFQPPHQISLNKINGQEISTVLLPRFSNEPKVWETCVFYANGHSQVVSRYTTERDAVNGHNSRIYDLMIKVAESID